MFFPTCVFSLKAQFDVFDCCLDTHIKYLSGRCIHPQAICIIMVKVVFHCVRVIKSCIGCHFGLCSFDHVASGLCNCSEDSFLAKCQKREVGKFG